VYVLSKLAWLLATPSNLLVFLGLLGASLSFLRGPRIARFGRRLGLGALLTMTICGFAPVGTWLLYPLEQRFPASAEDDRPLAGIIVLGGAILPNLSFDRRQLVLGDAAERVVALADLARRHRELRLIFTGGSGAILGDDAAEAAALARFGATLGIETARVTYERQSRTTWENARETKALLAPDADGRWLLVTSAWHMPRAMGAFRAAAINVVAYPVDYRTSPARLWRLEPSIASGLDRTDTAVREWAGLVSYRLAGRSSALFPR
jgi:uncharacterized SAM-binding protein YcdF (DUF218 family)